MTSADLARQWAMKYAHLNQAVIATMEEDVAQLLERYGAECARDASRAVLDCGAGDDDDVCGQCLECKAREIATLETLVARREEVEDQLWRRARALLCRRCARGDTPIKTRHGWAHPRDDEDVTACFLIDVELDSRMERMLFWGCRASRLMDAMR